MFYLIYKVQTMGNIDKNRSWINVIFLHDTSKHNIKAVS